MKTFRDFLAVIGVATLVHFVYMGCSGSGSGGGGSTPVADADSPEILARVAAIEGHLDDLQNAVSSISTQQVQFLRSLLSEVQKEILGHMSIVHLPTFDGKGGTAKTIRLSGVNLQIVNGLGATNGNPANPFTIEPASTATNGLGNLIVGYAESHPDPEATRTGSHNIVGGTINYYSSFGGLVAGCSNFISGVCSSVTGGQVNTAEGNFSSIAGGGENAALNINSSVSGGFHNLASGHSSIVSGGCFNSAINTCSSVSGGNSNIASGINAATSGGTQNVASGENSTVSGGNSREASQIFDWRAGELFQDQ